MMNKMPKRITEADLRWWLELAPTLAWTFAKTYAETAPHSYIVQRRTPNVTAGDFKRAAAVIRTFGQPAKYYDMTNIYLTSADGELKWWTMDRAVADTSLINQATADRVYGEQNAPRTRSGIWSVYDEIATDYDRLYSPVDGDEKVGLLRLLSDLDLPDAPLTLDIGCGTGAVLDLGVTTPDRYVGLDPSQGMLNELVIKHGRGVLKGVIPGSLEMVLDDLCGQRFELVIAAFGSASHLSADAIRALPGLFSSQIVLMAYRDGYAPTLHHEAPGTGKSALEALRRIAGERGSQTSQVGKFEVIVTNGDDEGDGLHLRS